MDDRPIDNDERSSFILSIEGKVNDISCSLADVSDRNDDSKIVPAFNLVVLGDDDIGRGEWKAAQVIDVIVATSSNAAMLEVPRMISNESVLCDAP
jgi:hypothetical protein